MKNYKRNTLLYMFFFMLIELLLNLPGLYSQYPEDSNNEVGSNFKVLNTEHVDSLLVLLNIVISNSDNVETVDNVVRQIINRATYLKEKGHYYRATEILLKTLTLIPQEEYKLNQAWCSLALSEICRASLQYESAQKYSTIALEVFQQFEITEGISESLNRKAAIYFEQMNQEEAFNTSSKSLVLARKINNQKLIASNLELHGAINRRNGNTQKAMDLFQEVLRICEELNDSVAYTNAMFNIMLVYNIEQRFDSAYYYGMKAYNMATLTGIPSQMYFSAGYLSDNFANIGDWKNAYKYKKISEQLRIELFNQSLQEQFSRLHAEYRTLKQERIIKEQEAMLLKDKHQRRIFAVVVFGLAVIVLLLFNFYIQKHRSEEKISKQNALLIDQKEKIENQALDLKKQNIKLIELDQFKNSMMNMVVHDLKNPLSVMISISELPASNDTIPIISQSARQMLNLVMNILEINRYENIELKPKLEDLDVGLMVDEVSLDFSYLITEKQLEIERQTIQGVSITADRKLIKRVVVNLMDNAIRFSPNKGEIKLEYSRETNEDIIHIYNEGPSIPRKHHQMIFKKYVQVGKYGGLAGKSTGLGLAFCKLVVEAHGGKIGVNSGGETGVDFWFSLPRNS